MVTLLSLKEIGGGGSENLQCLGLKQGDFDGLEVLQRGDIHSFIVLHLWTNYYAI